MKTIQSVDKAISIIELIAANNGKLTLTDISNMLDIKITTLHGLIRTLEYRNIISKNVATGKYQLGVKLFEFGKIYESGISIIEKVHPYLEEIASEFQETVHLAIPFKNQILYIDKVESSHAMRLTSMVGTTEKAYNSAIGMVILANSEKDQYESLLDGFDNTSANFLNNMHEEYEKIKRAGYYIKFEKENDFYCIAVPLLNSSAHIIGAISVVIPNCRYHNELSIKITEKLKETASFIQKSL